VNHASGFAWPSQTTVLTMASLGAFLGSIVGYLNGRRRIRLAEAQETMLGLHQALTHRSPAPDSGDSPR
jgi:hypothetical protein